MGVQKYKLISHYQHFMVFFILMLKHEVILFGLEKIRKAVNFARLSTTIIGLIVIETYSCLTLSGFLAVSGL